MKRGYELLGLVDADDVVIGTVNRDDYQQMLEHGSGYICAAELFIVNDLGQVWVPIRTAAKVIAPNGYDYSAAGHVEAGDDYVYTIIRETSEELNLPIGPDDLEWVAKLKSDDIKYVRGIFVVRRDESLDFNTDDFVSGEWLTPDEIIENIINGHAAKDGLPSGVAALKAYLDSKQ